MPVPGDNLLRSKHFHGWVCAVSFNPTLQVQCISEMDAGQGKQYGDPESEFCMMMTNIEGALNGQRKKTVRAGSKRKLPDR